MQVYESCLFVVGTNFGNTALGLYLQTENRKKMWSNSYNYAAKKTGIPTTNETQPKDDASHKFPAVTLRLGDMNPLARHWFLWNQRNLSPKPRNVDERISFTGRNVLRLDDFHWCGMRFTTHIDGTITHLCDLISAAPIHAHQMFSCRNANVVWHVIQTVSPQINFAH